MKRLALLGAVLFWTSLAPAGALPPNEADEDPNPTRRYTRTVLEQIVRGQIYPAEALAQGVQGQVLITAHIGADGQVKGADLRQSSGSQVLDQAALQSVLSVRNLPLPPYLLRGREFTLGVPIIYRIDQP